MLTAGKTAFLFWRQQLLSAGAYADLWGSLRNSRLCSVFNNSCISDVQVAVACSSGLIYLHKVSSMMSDYLLVADYLLGAGLFASASPLCDGTPLSPCILCPFPISYLLLGG